MELYVCVWGMLNARAMHSFDVDGHMTMYYLSIRFDAHTCVIGSFSSFSHDIFKTSLHAQSGLTPGRVCRRRI
jgi:hypothetical protein